jgi:hypothetical protein
MNTKGNQATQALWVSIHLYDFNFKSLSAEDLWVRFVDRATRLWFSSERGESALDA